MKMAWAGRVSQVFNLLYRRLSVGKALDPWGHRAGCKPAIRQITNLRHIFWSVNPDAPLSAPAANT
jgi:hypothetical protein